MSESNGTTTEAPKGRTIRFRGPGGHVCEGEVISERPGTGTMKVNYDGTLITVHPAQVVSGEGQATPGAEPPGPDGGGEGAGATAAPLPQGEAEGEGKAEPLKALSLWQPWASLIAVGAKRIETRSWPTKHRGPIAIHASAKTDHIKGELEKTGPIADALKKAGIMKTYGPLGVLADAEVPVGAVIAVADLVDCI